MELQLKIIGILLVTLGLVHAFFPKYFNWKKELSSLSLINKQMMEVHTFFIAFALVLMGILCFINPKDLIETKLGHQISIGFGIFWLVRLLFQFFIYSSKLWKGKTFETLMHILFSLLWIYLSFTFLKIGVQ